MLAAVLRLSELTTGFFPCEDGSLTRAAGSGTLTLFLSPGWEGTAGFKAGWSRDGGDVRSAIYGSADVGVQRKLSSTTSASMQLFGNYVNGEKGVTQEAGIRGDLKADESPGRNANLTFSPSYSMKTMQARNELGIGPPRTDHRVFASLKLEFNLP